ncbi:MAG: protoheme IX farnesyltransferase [Bacteroidia bacterium]|nr:protoheme IX farnesyltransferase [Bacteroidia bacterium]
MEQPVLLSKPNTLTSKLSDYSQFGKMRLASLVVFSAAMAFLTAPGEINWFRFAMLILGGVLTTASANGFNQVIERDLDKLMDRTAGRPIPDGRMSAQEGLLAGFLFGISGVFILAYFLNFMSGMLGLLSILLYTMAYTPMKRRSPFAVFIGAIPGAIPPLLGWVAATGSFGLGAWLLFSIQFLWQFPHFWAIAWVLDEDYKKAGFKMLPTGERDKDSAFQALLYTFSLLPLGFMPYLIGMSGWLSVLIISAVSLYFLWLAFQLFIRCDLVAARKLMFGSFIYLPVVQIALVIDKI